MDPLARRFERYRQHGDLRALGAVFDAVAPRLLALALHLCGNPADAEDALQQAFLSAMRRADTFDPARRLEPWLAGFLANSAHNTRRHAQRRRTEALPDVESEDGGPVAAAERSELVTALRTRVDDLPSEQRQVLLLQLQHGLSPAEIAEVLGVAPGTVRMRLHRGLQGLRRLLPAGLAAWVFGVLPTRGLAAVRQVVLRAGREQAVATGTTTATVLGGVMVMKQVALALAVLLVAALAFWWNATSGPEPVRAGGGEPPPAVFSVAPAVDAAAKTSSDPTVDAPRVAVDPDLAALLVRAWAVGERLAIEPGARGMPIPGCMVQVWPGEGCAPFERAGLREAATDAGGAVRFAGLAPGVWQVLAAADPEAQAQRVQLAAGSETIVDLERRMAGIVRGRVVDDEGLAVAEAKVWVTRRGGLHVYGRDQTVEPADLRLRLAARSGNDGSFLMAYGADEVQLAARKPGFGASFARLLAGLEAGGTLVLARQHATIVGTARDEQGRPVAGVLVVVTPAGQDWRRAPDGTRLGPRLPEFRRSDAEGRFEFDDLPAGRHTVSASAIPYRGGRAEVMVPAFGRVEVDLRLEGGVTVIGTVRHPDGTPALVNVYGKPDRRPGTGHYYDHQTRSDGSYLLAYVPTRRFVVTVEGRFGELAYREFEAQPPGLLRCDFVLEDTGSVRGRLLGPDERGLAGWTVTAADSDDGRQANSTTTADGAFALQTLRGATWTLRAFAPMAVGGEPAVERTGVPLDGPPIELRVAADAMPRGVMTGRLVSHTGALLVEHEVTLRRSDSWIDGPSHATRTTATGSFRFESLPVGEWEVRVRAAGWSARPLASCKLLAGGQQDLGELVLSPLATLDIAMVRAGGAPWQGEWPWILLADAAGRRADNQQTPIPGGVRVQAEPGSYSVVPAGPDLIATPQDVVLAAGETRALRFEVGIGRSRNLVCNGDGVDKPPRGALLHVVVRRGADEIVRTDLPADQWSLRGFYSWSLDRVFAFGRYEVEASTDAGRTYRASFEVRENLDDPTRVEVPLVGR